MAKKGPRGHIIIKSEESDHSYHTTKNKRNTTDRLRIKRFDPVLRKHVFYKEEK